MSRSPPQEHLVLLPSLPHHHATFLPVFCKDDKERPTPPKKWQLNSALRYYDGTPYLVTSVSVCWLSLNRFPEKEISQVRALGRAWCQGIFKMRIQRCHCVPFELKIWFQLSCLHTFLLILYFVYHHTEASFALKWLFFTLPLFSNLSIPILISLFHWIILFICSLLEIRDVLIPHPLLF